MALRNPPSWLQYGSHTAENDRLTQQAVYSSTGVIGNSMQVTQNGTPNMSVNVSSGWCSIVSSTSNAGVYVGYNDAAVNLAMTAGDISNPRIDLIVATVNDQVYSGSTNNITLQVIAGTPAGSPVVPSTPSNSVALAQIAVAANATTVVTANITDLRVPSLSSVAQNPIQAVHLTASGAAQGTGLPFGTSSRATVIAGRNYLVDVILPFTKTTAGTVTWSITSTTTGSSFAMSFSDSLNQSVSVYSASGSSALFAASASYATATTYVTRFYGVFTAGTNGRLYPAVSAISAGTITPLLGAQFTVTDLGPNATIGNIG